MYHLVSALRHTCRRALNLLLTSSLSHISQLHWVLIMTGIFSWLTLTGSRPWCQRIFSHHVLPLASQILLQRIWLHLISLLPEAFIQSYIALDAIGANPCGFFPQTLQFFKWCSKIEYGRGPPLGSYPKGPLEAQDGKHRGSEGKLDKA